MAKTINLTPMRQLPPAPPWYKRASETDRAYTAFQYYLDGATLADIAVMMEISKKGDTISGWKQKYEWVLRKDAYDRHMQQIKFEAAEREFIEEGKRMGVRQARVAMRMQELGGKRVEEYLANPSLQASISIGDATKLVAQGAELEREARGDDPEKGRQTLHFHFHGAAPKWAPKTITGEVVGENENGEGK